MPNHKYVVKIDKEKKRLNRIFDDMNIHKECVITDYNKKWHLPMQDFGRIIKKKSLDKEGFIEIWEHKNKQNNTIEKRLIRLQPGVEIIKKEGNDLNFFKFKRRKLV